jgi:hypothetical protein
MMTVNYQENSVVHAENTEHRLWGKEASDLMHVPQALIIDAEINCIQNKRE